MVSLSTSRTEDTYRRLREELVRGRFQPDAQISPAEVAARMGVSLGAVREALSRLTSECLVVAEPQRGFRVSPLSERDLADLLDARMNVEDLCLRRAIECGEADWESGLLTAYDLLSRTPEHDGQEGVAQDWLDAHETFHKALVSACDNAWLLWTRGVLYTQCERYRSLAVRGDIVGRDLNSEHRALMEAAIARDRDLACALLRKHYRDTARDWTEKLRARQIEDVQRKAG